MVAARYPGAVWRPVSYRMEAGKFTHTPLGWIPHVPVGNGSLFKTFENAQPPRRRFSHMWVSKRGLIEQYQDLTMKSWAQTAGNDDYWAVEFEGFPEEPYTDTQLFVAGQMHKFFGADDRLANKPGERGIGTHYMGGASYGGHSCPDPEGKEGQGPRSHQRQEIINRANGVSELTPAEMSTLVEMMWNRKGVFDDTVNLDADGNPTHREAQMETFVQQTFARAYKTQQLVAAMSTDALATSLANKLADILPANQPITQDMLNSGLRTVLGSVDGATPPTS